MKNKQVIVLILFILFGFNGMAQGKRILADTTKYSIVISFFSVSSGIDMKAKVDVDDYLAKLTETRKVALNKEETTWGREGERDYCMQLSNLSTKDRKKFVKKIKSIAKKSGRISVLIDSPCLHRH